MANLITNQTFDEIRNKYKELAKKWNDVYSFNYSVPSDIEVESTILMTSSNINSIIDCVWKLYNYANYFYGNDDLSVINENTLFYIGIPSLTDRIHNIVDYKDLTYNYGDVYNGKAFLSNPTQTSYIQNKIDEQSKYEDLFYLYTKDGVLGDINMTNKDIETRLWDDVSATESPFIFDYTNLPKNQTNIYDGVKVWDSANNRKAFATLTDLYNPQKYHTFGELPVIFYMEFPNVITLKDYYMLSRRFDGSAQYATHWSIKLSMDGQNWETVDYRSMQTFPDYVPDDVYGEERLYTCEGQARGKFLMVNITGFKKYYCFGFRPNNVNKINGIPYRIFYTSYGVITQSLVDKITLTLSKIEKLLNKF